MKIIWHKMSEKEPENKPIWWALHGDVQEINLEPHDYEWLGKEDIHWAYIEYPEPPEKERHQCFWRHRNSEWRCWEKVFKHNPLDLHGNYFFLEVVKDNGENAVSRVQFCPNCGEEAK